MEKNDIYKIFALGLVAVFVIEMVALGALNNNGSKTQQGGDDNVSTLDLTGSVTANLTIVRYEPYLIVNGNGSGVGEVVERLTQSGEITYTVAAGDSLIANLNSSSSAVDAAAEFEKANATVLANALISMPDKVRINGDGMAADALGSTFKWQMKPVYPEGSKVPASFVAHAQDGQVVGIGSLVLMPETVTGAIANAAVESVEQDAPLIQVEWADREAAGQIVKDANATYKVKSYIAIAQNATQEQIAAAKNLSFATGAQAGVVSVRNDFADEAQAGASLEAFSPSFPASLAYFENGSDDTEALLAKLQAAGINATLFQQASLEARLPPSIEAGGKNYTTGIREIGVKVPQAEGNITSVKLRLGFEAYGSAIAAITSVEVLEMGSGANPSNNQTAGQLPAAGNQPVPAANSSTSLPPLPAYNSTSNGTGSQPPPAMPAYNGSIVPPNASTGNGSEGPLLVPPPPAGTAN